MKARRPISAFSEHEKAERTAARVEAACAVILALVIFALVMGLITVTH